MQVIVSVSRIPFQLEEQGFYSGTHTFKETIKASGSLLSYCLSVSLSDSLWPHGHM